MRIFFKHKCRWILTDPGCRTDTVKKKLQKKLRIINVGGYLQTQAAEILMRMPHQQLNAVRGGGGGRGGGTQTEQ
jgi:hypothetical protein